MPRSQRPCGAHAIARSHRDRSRQGDGPAQLCRARRQILARSQDGRAAGPGDRRSDPHRAGQHQCAEPRLFDDQQGNRREDRDRRRRARLWLGWLQSGARRSRPGRRHRIRLADREVLRTDFRSCDRLRAHGSAEPLRHRGRRGVLPRNPG